MIGLLPAVNHQVSHGPPAQSDTAGSSARIAIPASERSGARRNRENGLVDNSKLKFILSGFSQVVGQRVFAFEGIASDRTSFSFTVTADLTLTRRYGILLQELPLLCRAVLERCHDGGENRAFACTEEEMRHHAAPGGTGGVKKHRRPPRRRVGQSSWPGLPW